MLLGESLAVNTLNKSGQKPLFVFEGYGIKRIKKSHRKES